MKKILENFPRAEAIVRNIYWRSPILQHLVSRMGKGRTATAAAAGFSIDELMVTLRNMGMEANEVVIVHSSMKKLAGCGLGANRIIESFMRQLCPDGTLVCPTFPLYADEPRGKERLTKDMSNVELV